MQREWPTDGLEAVPYCPACGSGDRELMHESLSDRLFSAPGKWSMYRCKSCESAYLDPRPNVETIGLAYQRYITHEKMPIFSSLSYFEKLRVALANGYRNKRYGTCDYPASILGILAAGLMPNGKAIIDAGMRHLPRGNNKGRLLDIGFGNGVFLSRASTAGWEVVGVDSDSNAVESARCFGIDVRLGGVESLDPSIEQFDVITLSHVIEHVHHPVQVLQICNRLLKEDGFLWIAFRLDYYPNVSSRHRTFFHIHHYIDIHWPFR